MVDISEIRQLLKKYKKSQARVIGHRDDKKLFYRNLSDDYIIDSLFKMENLRSVIEEVAEEYGERKFRLI